MSAGGDASVPVYMPRSMAYPKVPFAPKAQRTELKPIASGNTYSDGNNLDIDIMAEGAFLDPSRSFMSFTVTPTFTAATDVNNVFLDGGSHAVINDFKVTMNNGDKEIDHIPNYNIVYNDLQDVAVSSADCKYDSAIETGGFSTFWGDLAQPEVTLIKGYGCQHGATGTAFNVVHYPLGLLGSEKMVPLFLTGPIHMTLKFEDGEVAFVRGAADGDHDAAPATAGEYTLTYTITSFTYWAHLTFYDSTFNAQYVAEASRRPLELGYSTVKSAQTTTIGAGGATLNIPIRAKSLRSVFTSFRDQRGRSTATAAATAGNLYTPFLANRYWGGATGIAYLGSDVFQQYPNSAMTVAANQQSQIFTELKKAVAGHNGGRQGLIRPYTFLGVDKTNADSGIYIAAVASQELCEFLIGADLDSIKADDASSQDISGIDTTQSMNPLQLQIATWPKTNATTATIEVNSFGICDAVLFISPFKVAVWH